MQIQKNLKYYSYFANKTYIMHVDVIYHPNQYKITYVKGPIANQLLY